MNKQKVESIIFIIVLLVIARSESNAQSTDEVEFRNAIAVPSDTGRLVAIDKFIGSNPSSSLISDAYGARFSVLLELQQDSAAFASAHRYLAAKDSVLMPIGYHYIAMDLASRKQYLDSALMFVDSAIAKLERMHQGNIPGFFLTKAEILHEMGRDSAAESVLSYAVSLLPSTAVNDPRFDPYFIQLSLIETKTKAGLEGVVSLVKQCFTTSPKFITVHLIDSLLAEKIKDSARVPIIRDSLFAVEGEKYVSTSEDTSLAKGIVALNLSRNGELKDRSLLLATEACREVQNRDIEDRARSAAYVGIVLYNFGMYKEAEPYLKEAADFSSPYETEIFTTFGDNEEKLGKKSEAFAAYLKGALTGRAFPSMDRLETLQAELYPGTSLDSIIVTARYREMEFPVEPYEREEMSRNPKVVLAELFTGSECRPCQAVDAAFNKLLQRYDRSSLAVLEYHLNIPRPDPMGNPDADSRAQYYSVNSTPTVIIDGVPVSSSGGTLLVAKNKFLLYSDVIEKDLAQATNMSISFKASAARGRVKISVSAYAPQAKKTYRVHVVLAENDVNYTGSNFVSEHKFVVRKILKSRRGISFDRKGKASMKDVFDIRDLENDLKHYLDVYEQSHRGTGPVFKEEKFAIDRHKLYAVAFVQDEATQEVLQSKVIVVR